MRSLRYLLTLTTLAAVGCGRESPTAVGSSLLPASGIHSFEMVLDAPDFLQADTAVSGFTFPSLASFRIVAEAFGGTVYAHTLARFSPAPTTISVRDTTSNTVVTDTAPRFASGTVVLYVDSTADNGTTPILMRLYRTAEQWDELTATWTMRVDSGETHLPWTTPGGTVGALVDTATWVPGGADSVIFHVDSATIVAWSDTTNHARGALIAAVTPGTRLRSNGINYTIFAKSKLRPDTTVLVTPGTEAHTFVYTPPVPQRAGILQIGGAPSWRSFFRLRPDLWTRSFPCPSTVGTACSFTLRNVKVNFAALLLTPAPPGAFAPEDSIALNTWVVDTSSFVPLSRSPLGALVGAHLSAIPPATFLADVSSSTPISVPLTAFAAAATGDTLLFGATAAVSNTVAVVQTPEPSLFGVATFYGGTSGPLAPKLRLVLTLGSEVQLP